MSNYWSKIPLLAHALWAAQLLRRLLLLLWHTHTDWHWNVLITARWHLHRWLNWWCHLRNWLLKYCPMQQASSHIPALTVLKPNCVARGFDDSSRFRKPWRQLVRHDRQSYSDEITWLDMWQLGSMTTIVVCWHSALSKTDFWPDWLWTRCSCRQWRRIRRR